MAWPNDPLTTYAAGVQLKSADLNEIQDSIREKKCDLNKLIIPIFAGWPIENTPNQTSDPHLILDDTSAVYRLRVPIVGLVVGDVIRSAVLTYKRSSGNMTWIIERANAGSQNNVASSSSITTGTTWTTDTIATIDHTVLDANFYFIDLPPSATGWEAQGIVIEYDHP